MRRLAASIVLNGRESERRDPRADSLEVGRLQQRERRRAPQVREAGDQGEAGSNIVTDKLCLPVPEEACATRGGTSLGAGTSCFPSNPCKPPA
jgi:hypothetical protein